MGFKKILCVVKESSYTKYLQEEELLDYQKEFLQDGFNHQKKAKEIIKKELGVDLVSDTKLDPNKFNDYDLAISLGGDGTFLTTAQYCQNLPILGINSFPSNDSKKGSIGALTTASFFNLKEALDKLKAGNYSIEKWSRLKVSLDGKDLPGLAVNEVFFGPVDQDKVCDFRLSVGNHKDVFVSSGVIFSTIKGSTGWYQNAGGKFFKGNKIGVLIREANLQRKPLFLKKVVEQENIVLETAGEGKLISFDSRSESRYNLDSKKHIIKISFGKDLNVVRL